MDASITNQTSLTARAGDIAQLVGQNHKSFILKLAEGKQLQTHRGILNHDDLIGLPWGTQVYSHIGSSFFLLQPALGDLLMQTKRNTQIMYPKDIGFILVTMGIGPGMTVLEAGTGSGSLTTALAHSVGPSGRVISYEQREEMQRLAKKNLALVGMDERVTFKLGNIADGFDETGVDALFLDVQNPEDYIPQVRAALKPGGYFGTILPTFNQVSRILPALGHENFAFIEVCEILLRFYKPVPERIRPTDRMVAHTGFLVFGRPILATPKPGGSETDVEIPDEFRYVDEDPTGES